MAVLVSHMLENAMMEVGKMMVEPYLSFVRD